MQYIVAALYRFVSLPDYAELREPLLVRCATLKITGTFLLATEGINGTVAGSRESINALIKWFDKDPRFAGLDVKESLSNDNPFQRMKVKLKEEIVTLAVPGVDPTKTVGHYATSEEWNALLEDPEVLVIDTRNDYEVEIGSFKNAVNPNTRVFSEFPEYVDGLNPGEHKKVAMFCTGGIRCEKATSYMLKQGFSDVYHLQGGILKYLEDRREKPEAPNLWQGECFVFDDRVTVDAKLKPGNSSMCDGCGRPITPEQRQQPGYEMGISCPRCIADLTPDKRDRLEEKRKQLRLTAERAGK